MKWSRNCPVTIIAKTTHKLRGGSIKYRTKIRHPGAVERMTKWRHLQKTIHLTPRKLLLSRDQNLKKSMMLKRRRWLIMRWSSKLISRRIILTFKVIICAQLKPTSKKTKLLQFKNKLILFLRRKLFGQKIPLNAVIKNSTISVTSK